MRWKSVQFLLEGLSGQLTVGGELFVAPKLERGDISRVVSALVAIERAVFSLGKPRGEQPPHRILPKDVSEIEVCDVIVDFRTGTVQADLCERALFGVWQCSCHDIGPSSAAVIGGATAIESHLYRQTAKQPERNLISTTIVQTKTAIAPSLSFASEKSIQMVLHELRRLALTRSPASKGPAQDLGERPDGKDLVKYFCRVTGQISRRVMSRLRKGGNKAEPFSLRFGEGDALDFNPGNGIDMPRPENAFCADPFLFEKDGEIYCFYEEFPYETRRGFIAVARLGPNGAERIGAALVADHHLSFPCVFKHDKDIFLMPETVQAGRLEVWRSTDFPLGWELYSTALEGERLVDPMLFQKDDAWWLFVNCSHDSFGDFSSELKLFRTDGPALNWLEPHPLNPVVVGSDVARNGGRVFEHNGRIYRFSQDNSGGVYGYGLNLMEITELSETGYEEHRVSHITPDLIKGAVGCHHADVLGGKFVVDVRWL